MIEVPFNRPYTTGREAEFMADAVNRGHVSGDGHYTRRASSMLAEIADLKDVLLTTSCTHALEMSAILLDLQPGDEIIMPSFTFVSTANAFALRGARPVFVDIREDTRNIDESLIEAAITARTRAIVVVHYAGVACDMAAIDAIVRRHGLVLIEDNAHGLGGRYRGQQLGTFGSMSTMSFHETKNIHCGEGGALAINDDALSDRAEIIREKGTNRSRFFRGQVDKYTWVDIGSSYLPSDLLAAFLTAQLEAFSEIQQQRMDIWNSYATRLAAWAEHVGFALPVIPADSQHPAHLFGMLTPSLASRTRFIEHMTAGGIRTVFHYVPLHSSPMGASWGPVRRLPVTDDVSERLVRMPLFAGLTDIELDAVVQRATEFEP